MKTLIIAFFLLLTSSTSFSETKKQKKTQLEVISAFKKGGGKISPKLQKALENKIYSFDGNRVFPSFSHNVFWLNHLNPNFSITPRFAHEIIKESIWVTIPEKFHYEDIWSTRDKFKKIYVDDLTKPPTISRGDYHMTKPATPGTDPHWAFYGTANVGADDIVPGEKTLMGWAETYRAEYLRSQNPNLGNNASKDIAKGELAACAANPQSCNLRISIPPGDKIARGLPSCPSGSQCSGESLVITGKYSQPPAHPDGTPGAAGEWKPELEYSYNEDRLVPGTPGTPEEGYYDEKLTYPKKEELVKDGTEEYDTGEDEKVVDEKEKKVLEEREEERIIRAKKEWKFSFAPAYFFDYDFGKMILNQFDGSGGRTIQSIKEGGSKIASRMSRQENYSQDSQDYQYYLDSQKQQNYQDKRTFQTSGYQSLQSQSMQQNGLPPSDLVPNEIGPFVVKKFFNITAGLGATASANYANAGLLSQLGLSVALLPTLGGGATSIMIFDTLEYAEKAKHLNIPRSVEDILNWRTGDTLTYEVHGGVVFTGGAGFYGLAAGVSFLAQGIWQRTFSRIDTTTVLAKLDRNKMFSMGMYGAAGLAGISLDKFIVKENALTFAIDISSDRGKALLLDFMKGDMRKLQKAAENPKDPAVLSGMKLKGKTKGRSFSWGIGVPYLPASARWNKANFISESNTDYLGSNRKKDNTVHGDVFSFKGRFFPLFKNTTEGFFSNVTYSTGAVPTFLQTFKTGQYAFSFQRSYADNDDLEEVLNTLMRKTGLIGLLNVKISPDVEKVGSAEIKFAVKFKTSATNLLLDQANKNNLQVFDQIGQGFISAYFASLAHKKDDTLKLCPARTLAKCERRMREESEDAFSVMRKALVTMSKLDSKTKNSREKFARAYSKFGDAMMVNPFTLQTVLSMTLGYGADVYLSVETSKTKKFEAILRGIPSKARK